MSRLGQVDFFDLSTTDMLDYDALALDSFYDVGDFSTDIFDVSAVDFGYDIAALDGAAFGTDEFFTYDFPTTDTIGYDVADPLFGEPIADVVYAPALTMPDDYGDLYAPPNYGLTSFDPATGVGIGDEAYAQEWSAWEDTGAAELESTFGGNVEVAAGVFQSEFSGVSWSDLAKKGADIFKLYQKLQQPPPAPGKTNPRVGVMLDPRTGKPVPTVYDPRTGQFVPAVRDPRTGQLVPATQQAQLIPGVSNFTLLLGVGVAAFMFFR